MKSFLGNFYRHLSIFIWSHWMGSKWMSMMYKNQIIYSLMYYSYFLLCANLYLGDKLMDRRYNSQAVLHLVLYLAKQCFKNNSLEWLPHSVLNNRLPFKYFKNYLYEWAIPGHLFVILSFQELSMKNMKAQYFLPLDGFEPKIFGVKWATTNMAMNENYSARLNGTLVRQNDTILLKIWNY